LFCTVLKRSRELSTFGSYAFQSFVVQGEALDDVLAEPLRGPDAELRAAMGLHAVADGDDDVEVVVLDLIGLPVGGSCCRFCNNSRTPKLPIFEHVRHVPGDDRLVALEELGHLSKR
jgi:hypothetical protein